MEFFDHRTACYRNHQTKDDVNDGYLRSENAHQQHQTSQIHHGRGDEKGKGHPQGQPRGGKADEQWNGGAGAEGRHRSKQRGNEICPQPVKPPQDPLAPLRREMALDVGDHKNQQAQQHRDFDDIIEKELDASPKAGAGVQAQGGQSLSNGGAEPFHTQDLILQKTPAIGNQIHRKTSGIHRLKYNDI